MLHNSLFESFLLSDMRYNLVQSEIYESLQNSLPHIERASKRFAAGLPVEIILEI